MNCSEKMQVLEYVTGRLFLRNPIKGNRIMKKTILTIAAVMAMVGCVWAQDITGLNLNTQYSVVPFTALDTTRSISIPKSWKLISVTERKDSGKYSEHLWFQAPDGTIYVLNTFEKNDKFAVAPEIMTIPAK